MISIVLRFGRRPKQRTMLKIQFADIKVTKPLRYAVTIEALDSYLVTRKRFAYVNAFTTYLYASIRGSVSGKAGSYLSQMLRESKIRAISIQYG